MGTDYGESFLQVDVPFRPDNVYDIEARYFDALKHLFFAMHGAGPRLNLGKIIGDVTLVDVRRLHPSDLLLAGPPCPPWAGQGKKAGQGDVRALVFEAIIQWLVFMALTLGLKGVILENVRGVAEHIGGHTPFYVKLIGVLRVALPMFRWRFDVLQLLDYKSAQSRCRTFLRGLHVMFCPCEVPPPLPPFGVARLREFLNWDLPTQSLASLTPQMQRNMNHGSNHCLKFVVVLVVRSLCCHHKVAIKLCYAVLEICIVTMGVVGAAGEIHALINT